MISNFQGRVFIDRVHPCAFLLPKRRRRHRRAGGHHPSGGVARGLSSEKGGLESGGGISGEEGGDKDSDDNTTNDGTDLDPPVKLLTRCHNLSAAMSTCGFILACLGILAFLWTSLPTSVGIFGSACLGVCFVSGMIVFNST